MPRNIAKSHKNYLQAFVNGSIEQSQAHNDAPYSAFTNMSSFYVPQISFILHRNGYLIASIISKQLLCTFSTGINFIANIQVNSFFAGSDFFLTNENGRIEGISPALGQFIGMTPRLINEYRIFIQQFSEQIGTNS